MAYRYDFTAALCPAVLDPGDPILIGVGGASTPITTAAESLTPGETALAGAGRINRNFGRIDNLGRYGGGHAAGILWGLEILAATGLSVTITAGQAGIDSGAELAADATLALADATLSRIWLSRSGTLGSVTSGSATPLEPPDDVAPWAYLGACQMTAGALVGLVDRSGVLTAYRGGQLFRRTADTGAPGDTPPASVRLLTQTVGGLYLFDGAAHWRIGGSRETLEGFFQDNVSASQTAVELTRTSGAAAFPNKWPALRPGSITGVGVISNAARTAGTLTVTAMKNGTSVGLTAVLDAANPTVKGSSQAAGLDTFVAGDLLSLALTTDSGWSPTSADVRAVLEIETA